MATTSISAAVKTKYESLTAANFPGSSVPPYFFGQAPQVSGGLQLRPPYTVGTERTRAVVPLDFERNNLVTLELRLQVVAGTLADVDAIVNAIRWNGGTVGQGLGFDHGTLSDLTAPRSTHQMVPTGEPRLLENALDLNGQRVHGAELEYTVTVLESS